MATLIGLGLFAAFGSMSRPGSSKTVYFEADKLGKLRQVDHPAWPRGGLTPLWKPEPGLILKAEVSGLTSGQTKEVSDLSKEWESVKADLLRTMDRETAFLASASASRKAPPGLQESLANYSELSRLYEAKRASAWSRAAALLSKAQREQLDKSFDRPEVAQ